LRKKKNTKLNDPLSKPRSVSTTYHHGDLKNALLTSSIGLLRKHGPQSFSLRELALSLGVSSAAPYRHFKTKERIFAAIAVQGFGHLTKGFENAIKSHPLNPPEQLHAVGVSYYQFAVKYPEHLQMMFGNIISQADIAADEEFKAAAGKAFGTLVGVVKSCQTDGFLNPKEDPKLQAILLWSSIHGFASLNISGTLQGASGLAYNPELIAKQISMAMSHGLKEMSLKVL
jgi:AcrR family transcriptional regulator